MGDRLRIDVAAGDTRRGRRLMAVLAAAMAALAGVLAAGVIAPRSTVAQDEALPSVAFVARAGEFADALAASAVAGQLGAPLFLTASNELSATAADALASVEPDLVVLAGGEAALSSTVEQQVREAVPKAEVDRRGGATRIDTAVALADLAEDLGFDRPVLTGATVEGTAGAGGLEIDGQPVTGGDSELESRVAALESDLADAEGRIAELDSTLEGVDRTTDADGSDTLQFTGMNVQVPNGTIHTDALTVQDPGLVTELNADRIDGLHASELGLLDSYRDLDLEGGVTHANSGTDGNPFEEIVTRTIQVPVDGFLRVSSNIFMSEEDSTSQILASVTRLDWDPDVPLADQRDQLIGLDLHSPGGSEQGVGASFTTAGGIAVSAGTHTVSLLTQGADADTPYTTAGPRLTTLFVPFGTETVVDTSGG